MKCQSDKQTMFMLKNAVNNSRRAGAKATGNATRALENVKGAPKTHGKRDLTEAIEFGKARAKQNVEDLQAACDLYKMNPTPENLKLRNDLIMKCQSDKQTMFMLKNECHSQGLQQASQRDIRQDR